MCAKPTTVMQDPPTLQTLTERITALHQAHAQAVSGAARSLGRLQRFRLAQAQQRSFTCEFNTATRRNRSQHGLSPVLIQLSNKTSVDIMPSAVLSSLLKVLQHFQYWGP